MPFGEDEPKAVLARPEVERDYVGPFVEEQPCGPGADASEGAGDEEALGGQGDRRYRSTRGARPATSRSTSASVAVEVSPGVVIARAPWATP